MSVDHLVDCLWDRTPPSTARDTVRSHVMRLRKVLPEPAVLVTRAPGYLLAVDPSDVDVNRAAALQAHAAADPRRAGATLREALGLWRGSPLADIDSTVLRARHVRVLEDVWTRLTEARIDAELADGAHTDLVGELRTLVASHPLKERFHGQLMLALDATGQRAEALRAYRNAHRVLVDELGIEPGDELRRIHQRLLGTDRRRDTDVPRQPVPALLPLDANGFVGRERELARLDTILASAGSQPTATVMAVLSGTAGIGKTTLAVHWAHRVRDRFPDGQLYVNMRGFDHDRPRMSPAEAARIFLETLGVEPKRIPVSLEAQTGLYRSLLAGRGLLIVLDNASDPEQVRPLLPGSPGCVVLVTSRNNMPGLVAGEGAYSIPLDLMSEVDARALLDHRLGGERIGAEQDAVREIIARTAQLPLALAVVAARAATHPDFPLAALARPLHLARPPAGLRAGTREHGRQRSGSRTGGPPVPRPQRAHGVGGGHDDQDATRSDPPRHTGPRRRTGGDERSGPGHRLVHRRAPGADVGGHAGRGVRCGRPHVAVGDRAVGLPHQAVAPGRQHDLADRRRGSRPGPQDVAARAHRGPRVRRLRGVRTAQDQVAGRAGGISVTVSAGGRSAQADLPDEQAYLRG
ncbi:AfsR/SARP family transcriptional regulator [Saccharothrix deserti]|uniref:AfsR/SARP family transcriptional regulator n=1 Tax=Saccharothrix deserti TaxID=2593674 RepID=UPI001EE4B9A3|nr:BTAD domain-containing putative transcriptional regulator [Saccharothrix deserti]